MNELINESKVTEEIGRYGDRAEQFLELLLTHSWNDSVRLLKAEIAAELELKELKKVS